MNRNIPREGFATPEWRDALLERMARTAKERLLDRRAELYDEIIAGELEGSVAPRGSAQLATEQRRRELRDLDLALERIADGSWGMCERCKAPIGLQRLTALPEAALCIRCSAA